MNNVRIFIIVIAFMVYFKTEAWPTENVSPDNTASELMQLRKDIQALENDYKPRIKELEDKVSRSEELYMREQTLGDQMPFYGSKGSIMNPDISIVADAFYHFSDQSEGVGEFTDNDLFFREVELAIQGYIYPGIRAEVFPTWEVEEDKVAIEEAFANFLTLPFNSNLLIGRQRTRFGLVNPTHQEFQPWVDTPLAVQNIFGQEPYIDDGFDLSIMVPGINIPTSVSFGIFDGDKSLGEDKNSEEDNNTLKIFETAPVEWKDHVFLSKLNINIPLFDNADISLAYNVLWDGNGSGNTAIHNGQFSFRYTFPNSYHRFLWQNEVYVADIDDRDVKSKGFYSFIKYDLTRYMSTGFRYDWSEPSDNDDLHQWAINPIVTWNLTEASYIRFQYRYGELEDFSSVNEGMLQFVWGLGPHSHGLKN